MISSFDQFYRFKIIVDVGFEFTVLKEGVNKVALRVVDAVAGEVFFAG